MSPLALTGNIPEILRIENEIRQMPQVGMPVTHYQIDGVYVRSLFIPAGTILTGKIHKHENIAILAQGTIRICNGTDSKVISAPYVLVDEPGIKRLGYAETDVTFITVHKVKPGQPLEGIEQELAVDTYEEYDQFLLGVDA
jgi:hypothetical protein